MFLYNQLFWFTCTFSPELYSQHNPIFKHTGIFLCANIKYLNFYLYFLHLHLWLLRKNKIEFVQKHCLHKIWKILWTCLSFDINNNVVSACLQQFTKGPDVVTLQVDCIPILLVIFSKNFIYPTHKNLPWEIIW